MAFRRDSSRSLGLQTAAGSRLRGGVLACAVVGCGRGCWLRPWYDAVVVVVVVVVVMVIVMVVMDG